MIRHSTSGSELASSRLCPGVSTLQMVARASASIDRGAGNAISRLPGAGIENMRVPLSVHAKAALGAAAGGHGPILDLADRDRLGRFRIRPRGSDAEGARGLAADAKIAANVQQQAVQASAWHQRGSTGAIDDISLGDGIEAERAIGQPLDRVHARCDTPGRLGQKRPGRGQLGVFWRTAATGGPRPETRHDFDPGIEGTAAAYPEREPSYQTRH